MSSNAASGIPDKWLYASLVVLILWLPISLGSTSPLSLGILEAASLGLLSIWMFLNTAIPSKAADILKPYRIILLLMSFSLVYQLLQVLPLPLNVIGFLSPATERIYRYALANTETEFFTLSLDPGLTLSEFLKSASYFSVFLLVLVLTNTRKRAEHLVYVIIYVSLAESCWALVDFHLDGVAAGKRASGTYANPNHFGALLEFGIPATLGMIIRLNWHSTRQTDWRIRLSRLLDALLKEKVRLYIYLIIMFAALFYSGSRGAIFSLFFTLFITMIVTALIKGCKTREARLIPRILLLVFVAVLWLGIGNFITRLEAQGLQSNRSLLNRATIQMIVDYPLFGIGAGNWPHLYPMYRDPEMTTLLFTRHAHNDHLELLSEQGSIGYGLILSAFILAVMKMVAGLWHRHDPFIRGILFACVTGSVSLLIHSWVEFNFSIPANAAYFYLVLALGLVSSRLRRED